MSAYREHAPAPDLAGLVACTWERRGASAGEVRVLPEAEPDPLVVASLGLLGRRESSVAELSRTLAIGERALRRRFDRAIGYGPKKLDRIIRFRRFLHQAGSRRETSLAETAFEVGYADQAHLTRECRRLSGLTPGDLLGA